MNYELIEVETNGNGGGDFHRTKAISDDYAKLEEHCKETYGKEVGKPEIENFTWDNYFIIEETDTVIV